MERRKKGWMGRRKGGIEEGRKEKQRVRDMRGREQITVNMCLGVSLREVTEPLFKC